MSVRAVFFDLDDTLVATSSSRVMRAELAAARIIEEHRHFVAEELIKRMLARDPRGIWPMGAEAVVEELGIAGSAAGKAAAALWYFEGCEHLLTPVEGFVDLIYVLHPELTLGVITNGSERIQRYKFDRLGISERIAVFLTSDRAGCFKPDVRIFEMAASEAGIAPHEAVFIGDNFDTDIAGSLAAGMHAVWLNPEGRVASLEGAIAHHDVRVVSEITAILDSLR